MINIIPPQDSEPHIDGEECTCNPQEETVLIHCPFDKRQYNDLAQEVYYQYVLLSVL